MTLATFVLWLAGGLLSFLIVAWLGLRYIPRNKVGGRRGKQLQAVTDGTYFIDRWLKQLERFVEGFAARADAPPAVEDK